MMLDQELSNGSQVVGNDAPTDPTFHATFAMSQTAIQVTCTSQLADAALNPIAETLGSPKPGLPLMLAATVGFITGLGQADPAHAQGPCLLLIFGRVNAAISTHFLGGLAEHLAMMLQTGDQELRFARVALQEAIFADQAAFDFTKPDLATELSLFRFGFAAANQGRMWLEQAQHLSAGSCGHSLQHPLLSLLDDPLHQWQILIELCIQSVG